MKPTNSAQDSQDFEQNLAALEALVERMEAGELSLSEALASFEQGVELTRRCQQALQDAELKVLQLSNPDGAAEEFAGHSESGQ